MFEHLKSSTLSLHQSVEKVLVSKLRQLSNPVQYGHLLQIFYAFYQPLELSIHKHLTTGTLPDLDSRLKTPLLEQDLLELGMKPGLADPEPIQVTGTWFALGCLYVSEGSTLGGQVIYTMLQKMLGEQAGRCRFFNPYMDKTHERWQKFKHQVQSLPDPDITEMEKGASSTFIHLKHLLETYHYHEQNQL